MIPCVMNKKLSEKQRDKAELTYWPVQPGPPYTLQTLIHQTPIKTTSL